jgi:hypothetical protein
MFASVLKLQFESCFIKLLWDTIHRFGLIVDSDIIEWSVPSFSKQSPVAATRFLHLSNLFRRTATEGVQLKNVSTNKYVGYFLLSRVGF